MSSPVGAADATAWPSPLVKVGITKRALTKYCEIALPS